MSITFVTEMGSDQVIRPPVGVRLPHGKLQVTVQQVQPAVNGEHNDRAAQEDAGAADDPMSATRAMLLSFAREMEQLKLDLPNDLAEQHDHYLYGTPKR